MFFKISKQKKKVQAGSKPEVLEVERRRLISKDCCGLRGLAAGQRVNSDESKGTLLGKAAHEVGSTIADKQALEQIQDGLGPDPYGSRALGSEHPGSEPH